MEYAKLPNGSRFALGGRNPMSANVRKNLAKAAAIAAEFGMVFDCSLIDATAIHDRLLSCLHKDAAHRLLERKRQFYQSLTITPETGSKGQRNKKVLH